MKVRWKDIRGQYEVGHIAAWVPTLGNHATENAGAVVQCEDGTFKLIHITQLRWDRLGQGGPLEKPLPPCPNGMTRKW